MFYICYFKNSLLCKGENSGLEMCCNTYGYITYIICVRVQVAVLRVVKAVSAVAKRSECSQHATSKIQQRNAS